VSHLATMADPLDDDCAHAAIVLVYRARESLSIAERQADIADIPDPSIGVTELEGALKQLHGAVELTAHLEGAKQGRLLLGRAIRATEAALGQVHLYDLYAVAEPTPLETKQSGHLRGIWRRAAEAARQEAHRALHELTETFPDAYDAEEL
jgi:hypothetical protein